MAGPKQSDLTITATFNGVTCTIRKRYGKVTTFSKGARMPARVVLIWQTMIQNVVQFELSDDALQTHAARLTEIGFTDVVISRPELFTEEESTA